MSLMAYEAVKARSGGHCEAVVILPSTWAPERFQIASVVSRCGKTPVETHHRLTRGRGGVHLDHVAESYHLMHLCRRCHAVAHDAELAFEAGLLIEGRVTLENDRPVYRGPDEYLTKHYPGGHR